VPARFRLLCAPTAFKPQFRAGNGPPGDARITNQGGSTNSVLPPRSPSELVWSALRVERGTWSSQRRG